jgi:hypothetical protein
VIYKPEDGFDRDVFEVAKRKHYAISPECESREKDPNLTG